jgi:hypothetical protein
MGGSSKGRPAARIAGTAARRAMAKVETIDRGRPAGRARLALIGLAAIVISADTGAARAEVCAREAFEKVVDEASSVLVRMTQTNTPTFQTKLRALKDKRGWSNEQLMKEGQPFVRDERIANFDERSEQLLIKINTQGGDSSDCKVLAALKQDMRALVETQTAKWTYMFEKIEKELAR